MYLVCIFVLVLYSKVFLSEIMLSIVATVFRIMLKLFKGLVIVINKYLSFSKYRQDKICTYTHYHVCEYAVVLVG